MTALILAIAFTLSISAICSLLEAMVLSTTTVEIEDLRRRSLWRGQMLERLRNDMEQTSSAILALNTIANTLGATLSGGIFTRLFPGEDPLLYFSIGMTLGILVFSEIVPKNVGVLYRRSLQPVLVYLLWGVCMSMYPFSRAGKVIVRLMVGKRVAEMSDGDKEIILLAEKNAKEGTLTRNESAMISNALSLDDTQVRDLMTPRTVVRAYEKTLTLETLFAQSPDIPFARLPVYEENVDNIKGMVRRRDLLRAMAEDKLGATVGDYMQETLFVPENATATDALSSFLSSHQQFAVAVDEFGSVSGVVTMEDIVEHILGQEIYEKDDIAIDMRELARRKKLAENRRSTDGLN